MVFGKFIHEKRIEKEYTLRSFFIKLKSLGFKKDISQYSKIERGIQNPQTKEEFLIILEALDLRNDEVIKKWEKEVQKLLPEKEIDRMKLLPAFLPKNIDSKEKLDKLLDSLEDAYKPDFSED